MLEPPIDRIKLMPDYGCEIPLWGDGGHLDIEDCRQLGLSVDLIERLVAWQSRFDAGFDWERGWSMDPAAREPWQAQGEALAADLRRELPAIALVVDLWPIAPRRTWWRRSSRG